VETEVIGSEEALEKALAPGVPARHVIIYGAGHVGKALVLLLAQSSFAVTWCDPRDGAFPAVVPANVLATTGADLLQPVLLAQQGALVVVMSHSHALDFEVADAALRNDAIARVLLIGSLTKRARFLSRLKSAGHSEASLSRLICPIGDSAIAGKTPYAVALSTAHQLVALDEAFCRAQTVEKSHTERRAG
jgi:xanthine dehydrogenase accessory factor